MEKEDKDKLCSLANKAITYREAKGWEYWKKRNPNLTDEELEEKVEQYVNKHPETNKVIETLLLDY